MTSQPGLFDAFIMIFGSFFMAAMVGGLVASARGPGWAVLGLGAMTWMLSILILAVAIGLKYKIEDLDA